MSQEERDRVINEIIDEILGLGPIDPLLRDPTITDILINGPRTVYVERRGRLEHTNVVFHDEQHVLEIVQRIASRVGRRLDESSPMVDARLPDGSRVNAVIRPLAIDGALVSIRRFSTRPLLGSDLVARKSIAPEMIEFLAACVRARLNVLISGGTGSGKTTFLNMLSAYIADDERIATIEDAAELQLQQPHVARWRHVPPIWKARGKSPRGILCEIAAANATGPNHRRRVPRGGSLRHAQNILKSNGVEALLQAMTTGHDGGLTTIHANNTREAISRLEMLVGMAGYELPLWFIHRQIASAIDIVVQCARLTGGARKVVQISEVTGAEGEVISMHDLFVFEQTGVDENKAAQGVFRATGLRPPASGNWRPPAITWGPHSSSGGCSSSTGWTRSPLRVQGDGTQTHQSDELRGGDIGRNRRLFHRVRSGLAPESADSEPHPRSTGARARRIRPEIGFPEGFETAAVRDGPPRTLVVATAHVDGRPIGSSSRARADRPDCRHGRPVGHSHRLRVDAVLASVASGRRCRTTRAVLLRRDHATQPDPRAANAVARSLRVDEPCGTRGQTMSGAMSLVAAQLKPPVSEEFACCCEQQNFGLPREVTLQELARRTSVMELQLFVVAMLVHGASGGNPVEILDNLSEVVRKRIRMVGKVKALTSEGRLQAVILSILPVGAFVAIYILNRSYAQLLLDRPALAARGRRFPDSGLALGSSNREFRILIGFQASP